MSEKITVAERAVQELTNPPTLEDRLFFTGRMLVKQTFEDMELPGPDNANDLVQYYAPELKRWARPLFKAAAAGYKKDQDASLLLQRLLSLNEAARDPSQAIAIYNKDGKVA